MRHAIYQMDIVPEDPAQNRRRVEAWVARTTKEQNPDIVVLPEMWTTAYTLPQLEGVADIDGEPTTGFLRELAERYDVHIIGGSIANQKNGRFYNTALVVNRNGEWVYQYDKIHLVPMLNEPAYLSGGQEKVNVFEIDDVKMGLIICYDLRFPELARNLALQGAQVLYVVAEWPSARKDHWMALQKARAIENQMYVVSCDRVGVYDGTDFSGASLVIDPWGTVIAEGSENREETITSDISLAEVPRVREDVPVFASRVPALY